MKHVLVFFLLATFFQHCYGETYYDTLGIAKNATQEEIKQAYTRLALIHHPDRAGVDNPEIREKFNKIQEAYEALSHVVDRAYYDYQLSWLKQNKEKPFPGRTSLNDKAINSMDDTQKEQYYQLVLKILDLNHMVKKDNLVNNTPLFERKIDEEYQAALDELNRKFGKWVEPQTDKPVPINLDQEQAKKAEQDSWYIRVLTAHTKNLSSAVEKSYAKKDLFGDKQFHWTEIVNTIISMLDQALRGEQEISQDTIKTAMKALEDYFDKLLTVKNNPAYKNYLNHPDFLPEAHTPKNLAQRVEEFAQKIKTKISRLKATMNLTSPLEKALAELQQKLKNLQEKLRALSEQLNQLKAKVNS